jgi:1,4-dihydroxy-2-naphthoate octaprenyltransferase
MASIQTWALATRPKTLFAAVSPVLIGMAMASGMGVFHALSAILALVSAVLIQIGTNFFNDYADFESGADSDARKGPVRGVLAGTISAAAMKNAAVLTFGLAVLAGGYLMYRGGWPIVLIGASSIAFGFLYTSGEYSLSRLGIADLFVFVFFGPVAVAGTYYVQALAWPPSIWLAGIAPGLMSVAILLVNNIRDIEEDRIAGKKTLIVRLGRTFGIRAYIACLILSACVAPMIVIVFGAPFMTMAASLVFVGAIPAVQILLATSVEKADDLNPVLASTARLLFFYSILYSSAWVLNT